MYILGSAGKVVAVLAEQAGLRDQTTYTVRMDTTRNENDVREMLPRDIRLVLSTGQKLALLDIMVKAMSDLHAADELSWDSKDYTGKISELLLQNRSFISKFDYAQIESGKVISVLGQPANGNVYLILRGTARVYQKVRSLHVHP